MKWLLISHESVGREWEETSGLRGALFSQWVSAFFKSKEDFLKSSLRWRKVSLGLVAHRYYVSDTSAAVRIKPLYRLIPLWQKSYPHFLRFACMDALPSNDIRRLFLHACPMMNKSISPYLPDEKMTANMSNSSVKVVRHCDWEDNKHVLPSCMTTQCVMVHCCSACAYHAPNQACNGADAAKLQWHFVLFSLFFFCHIYFSTWGNQSWMSAAAFAKTSLEKHFMGFKNFFKVQLLCYYR